MALHGFALGGMEEHAVDLACGIAGRGHEVSMLLPYAGGGPLAPLIPRLTAAGVQIEARALLGIHGIGNRLAAWRDVFRWMRRQRFDVFHLHRYNPYHSHALPMIAALAGIRTRLVSEQDPGLEFQLPSRAVAALGDSFVTAWIVASSFSERCIVANTRRNPAHVRRVALGIPTDRFEALSAGAKAHSRSALQIPDDALVIGTLCRLVTLKGIDDLLVAAPGLLERFPNLQILVAGGGPESDRLIEAGKKIGDRLRFLGRVESTAGFLAALDVFAFPSRYEGYGLAVAEAMASGLPVVGTRVGAIEEMLTESRGGTVVAPSDPTALAAGVGQYLADPEARKSVGEAGRAYALKELSLSAMIDRFEIVYRSTSGPPKTEQAPVFASQ